MAAFTLSAWSVLGVAMAANTADYFNVGLMLYREGRFADAEKQLAEAMAMAERSNDPQLARITLYNGLVAFGNGKLEQSEWLLKRAIPLLWKTGGQPHADVGEALAHLGLIAERRGDADGAASYRQAADKMLARAVATPQVENKTRMTTNSNAAKPRPMPTPVTLKPPRLMDGAGFLAFSGNTATESAKPLNTSQEDVYELLNRGVDALNAHNLPQAEPLLKRALMLAERDNNQEPIGHALTLLGYIAFESKDNVAAIAYLERALPLRRANANIKGQEETRILNTLRQANMNLGRADVAEEWNRQLFEAQQVRGNVSSSPDTGMMAARGTLGAATSAGPDYLARQGKNITRWNDETKYVLVHIRPGDGLMGWHPRNVELVKAAFAEWEQALNKRVQFLFLPDPANVDVKVFWTERAAKEGASEVGGRNIGVQWGKYIQQNDIELTLNDGRGNAWSPYTIQSVALHEIGHMLGLKAHSDDPNDVMAEGHDFHNQTQTRHLTARDIATINGLYNMKPSVTNPKGVRLAHFEKFKKSQGGGFWIPIPIPLLF